MLHQIKAQQFYTDFCLYQQCSVLQKLVEFKDFPRLLSDFPVLFKAGLTFKDFSRKPSKSKYFSSLCEPWCVIYLPLLHISQPESAQYHVWNMRLLLWMPTTKSWTTFTHQISQRARKLSWAIPGHKKLSGKTYYCFAINVRPDKTSVEHTTPSTLLCVMMQEKNGLKGFWLNKTQKRPISWVQISKSFL